MQTAQIVRWRVGGLKLILLWPLVVGFDQTTTATSTTTASPEAKEVNPWSIGVTVQQREKAEARLAQGNALFLDADYRGALQKYREALRHYAHPAVHFNIARALINLDRSAEAFESIEAALRYGPKPLRHLYQEARNYQLLLKAQFAELEIRCDQELVEVSMDGKPVLMCPGRKQLRVKPGRHQVVARRPGYLTVTRDIVVLAGPSRALDLHLVRLADALQTTRLVSAWKPWTVLGSGLVLGGLGTALYIKGRRTRDDYQRILNGECSPEPCDNDRLTSIWRRGRLENGFGVGSMVVGGALTLGGIVFVFLNQPQTKIAPQFERPGLKIIPQVSSQSVGALLSQTF